MQRRLILIAARKQKERKEEDILITPCFCHLSFRVPSHSDAGWGSNL